MSPARKFTTDEARIVALAQEFSPSYFREYLMWTHVWRSDPDNGRGPLPSPVGTALQRGQGIFWDVLDGEMACVQCYHASEIRIRLQRLLEERR
jgi:hypothetical protein